MEIPDDSEEGTLKEEDTSIPLAAIIVLSLCGYVLLLGAVLACHKYLLKRGACQDGCKTDCDLCFCCRNCAERCDWNVPSLNDCLDAVCPSKECLSCVNSLECWDCCFHPSWKCPLRMSVQPESRKKRTNRSEANGVATALEKAVVKRSHLRLFERIRIIRSHKESGCKKSVRALSKEFNISKSAVAEILRKKELYVEQYHAIGAEEAELTQRCYMRLGNKMRIVLPQENAIGEMEVEAPATVEEQPTAPPRPPARRSHLCLDDKVQIIRAHHESGGKSVRALSEIFKVSKSAVAEILKKRHLYLRQYDIGDPQLVARRQVAQHDYLSTLVWQWFQTALAKKVSVTRPLLKELAQTYGDALGMEGFDANDEWLECFIRNRRIKQSIAKGSGNDVAFIKQWKMSLPDLVGGYEAKDVFVCDETGLLYAALPSRSLASNALHSFERWTVLLCCSAMGEKVRPFVCTASTVPHHAKDLCMRSGKQARMTPELFYEFLSNLNDDLKTQGRQALLFADDNYSHRVCSRALSNIRLELFPSEVASFVQPLDLGVIRLFKSMYRTELLRHTAALQQSVITAQQASWWVAGAWKFVPEDAIRRCFNEAGFPVACTEFYLTSESLDVELLQLSEILDRCKDWAGVAPHEYVTFDNGLETDSAECLAAASEEGPTTMTYEEMLRTVDRLLRFAVTNEPGMVASVTELKSIAEVAVLKRYREKQSRNKQLFGNV